MVPEKPRRRFRSQDWFDDPTRMDMVALYLERWMNSGLTPKELRSGRADHRHRPKRQRPHPCNRVHLDLALRVRDGIRDAGGVPMEFPPTRCSRIAGGPPRRSTATSPISAWWKSCTAIPSTRWC